MNSSPAGQPDAWAFFDKIYCISLRSRGDRKKRARQQFAEVGLLHRVEFIVVDKHPDNPEQGIYESHMRCLRLGIAADARNILVFEDDIVFSRFDAEQLRQVCLGIDRLDNWNALFLGCITDGSRRTGQKNLVRITYRCLAHAYALNRKFAEQVAQLPWNDIPFDELLRRHNTDFYALYPMCAFQGAASSDNRTVVIDRVRRLCGGLTFIQRSNEFYQNNKILLRLAVLMLLLVLAAAAARIG